jgi:hypothetical protein
MIRAIICLGLLWPTACFADDADSAHSRISAYFSSGNILKFADYLYENGDYLRAAGEYQRYLFSSGSPASSDSVYYRMTKAVFLGRDYQRCNRLLSAFGGKYAGSIIAIDIPLYQSIVEYCEGDYRNSLVQAETSGTANTELRRAVLSLDYLHLRDYKAAEQCACRPVETDFSSAAKAMIKYAAMSERLCEKARAANSLPLKSHFRAGLYSALIPGAGKVYCGRVADGIYSFLVVGLAAWQAYDGFAGDGINSGKGWVFAALGSGFYLGNIYGSVLTARISNRDVHTNFLNGLGIELTLP